MTNGETEECPACGHESSVIYRCEECGRDLAKKTETHGRMDG
jgi:predicted RNA-binding Zn-ribbon protein involved in translation (DUF1610 family)